METVLIIEDDPILLAMYRDKFVISDFTVLIAVNGEEGLTKAFQNHPDLILLDLAMPKLDGMTMLKKLRADAWGQIVPVIILTNLNLDGKILAEIITYKPTYSLMKANTTPEDVLAKARDVCAG